MIFLYFFLTVCCSTAHSAPVSDKLVAVVEKNAITEQDLSRRFELYRQLKNDSENITYENTRESLLEDLCLEQVESLFWQDHRLPPIEFSNEQLAMVKEQYPHLQCEDTVLKDAYIASMRRDRLKRIFVQHHVPISSQELKTATEQSSFWQSLNARWSFELAYSDKPFRNSTDAEMKAKSFSLPVGKIAGFIVKNIDWSKTRQWQYFENDGEFVAFRLNTIALPHVLSHIYRVELCAIEQDDVQNSSQKIDSRTFDHLAEKYGKNFIEIASYQEVPQELWAQVESLSAGEVSSVFVVGNQAYVAKLIDCAEPLPTEKIQAILADALKEYRAEERLPFWYDEMKQQYFIKVFA